MIVLLVLLARDRANFVERDKREAAATILNDVQQQFDGVVSSSIRSARRLAARIGPQADLDQNAFAALVEETVQGNTTLVRAEYAPGFVTELVYPLDGNEAFVGRSPMARDDPGVPDISAEIARGFPILKRIDVNEYGVGQLEVQAEIREAVDGAIQSSAVINLVVDFNLVVRGEDPFLGGDAVEFLLLSRPAGAPPPDIPQSWRTEGNIEPVRYVMRYPPGDFLLFLRPLEGWAATPAEMFEYWMQLAGIGFVLFVSVALANRIAVSNAETQAELTDTRKDLSGILQNLPGAAFTITAPAGATGPGPDDKIRFHNPDACKELWGIDASDLERDAGAFWRTVATPEDAERIAAAGTKSLRKLEPFDEVWPIRTPEGEEKWLLGRALPIRQEDGTTLWSAIVFDYTAQIKRQEELDLHQEMVFRAQKHESVGQMAGGIAHDFNNLLTVVLGNLELLKEDETDQTRRATIDSAIGATLRGAHLTRSMLAFAGRSRLKPERMNLNDVLNELRSWMDRTLPSSVSITTNLEREPWPIEADRAETESAILNLILNARDAMNGKGQLTIETANRYVSADDDDLPDDRTEGGRFTVLTISDTGPGIAEDQIDKVFEPFFTTKGPASGSGLGLSMVQGFMEQSGGWVHVRSRAGEGASFKLFFPTIAVEAVEDASPVRIRPETDTGKYRILLVDDEAPVRDVLFQMLKREGHNVVTSQSGDDALELLQHDMAFDLLITDIVMPGRLQGDDLASAAQELVPDLPVLLISGNADLDAPDGETSYAGWHRLFKPVLREDLLHAINSVTGAQDG
ncbi:MAG: ATP-binding protein [Pseudomonadota bacterium]